MALRGIPPNQATEQCGSDGNRINGVPTASGIQGTKRLLPMAALQGPSAPQRTIGICSQDKTRIHLAAFQDEAPFLALDKLRNHSN